MSPNAELAVLMERLAEAERVLIEANNEATSLWYAMIAAEDRLGRARSVFNALEEMVVELQGGEK